MKKTNDSANVINISKKAYEDFAGRLRYIFIEQLGMPTVANEALTLFDRYVRGEEVAIGKADRIVQIAFMMIQSEIDQAIARSKAARQRAAVRKMNRAQAATSMPAQEMPSACKADETAEPDNVKLNSETVQPDAAKTVITAQNATDQPNDAVTCDETMPADGVTVQIATEQPSELEAQDETAVPVMMNRRARREYERELRREMKREQRRQARMNSMEYML